MLQHMKQLTFAALLIAAAVFAACTTTSGPTKSTPAETETVLFMCPYGGAKSVIATTYFNHLAERVGLGYRAAAVAAETPYDAVPEKVAAFLLQEGFDVQSFKPRQVAAADLDAAAKVVSIDCDLAKLDTNGVAVERWDDVPKVSADLPGSAAAIRKHVETLVAQLKSTH